MSAEELGKRLLAETVEADLNEILNDVYSNLEIRSTTFGFEPLDQILRTIEEAGTSTKKQHPPIVELTSLIPGGGKTHLIYHLATLAILPTHLGGRQSCIIVFDTDARFSIPRLVEQIRNVIRQQHEAILDNELKDLIFSALKHVFVLHPQFLNAIVSALEGLPEYLFDMTRHSSFERRVGFIALDSASSFYWQSRSDEEDAAILAKTSSKSRTPLVSRYHDLSTALKAACRTFACPLIFTSWYLGLAKSSTSLTNTEARSARPSLPSPWSPLPNLRLITQRVPIRKIPTDLNLREASLEAESRQKVVQDGKFECFVNEWGIDERTLRALQASSMGFEFWITDAGIAFKHDEVM